MIRMLSPVAPLLIGVAILLAGQGLHLMKNTFRFPIHWRPRRPHHMFTKMSFEPDQGPLDRRLAE